MANKITGIVNCSLALRSTRNPQTRSPYRLFHLRRLWIICLVFLLISSPSYAQTLEFWHPWPHANRTVQQLAAQYTRQTGVRIRVRTFQPSAYRPWTGRSTPDIIGLYRPNKKTIDTLASSGRVYNLQSQMSQGWYSTLWPGLLETFTIRRNLRTGVYGVPLTGQVYVFVYNRNLFRKAGVSAPIRSWQELMIASQRLRKAGFVPYAGGFGSSMPPLPHAYEWSYMGLHNLSETYFGRYPYTSANWVRELSLYPEMYRYGFTNAAWASVSETNAMKHLINGRVAMVFVGPNFQTIRVAYKPAFKDWGIFSVPADNRARFLPRQPGGVVEGIVINQRSQKKQAAVRFARWLTQPRQQIIMANGSFALPANPSAGSSASLRGDLKPFISGMSNQSVDLRVYESTRVLSVLYSGTRSLLQGRNSPNAVARNVQRAKRR